MTSRAMRKGKNYERHIARLLGEAFGCNVRRTPGSGNLDIKGDLRNLAGTLEKFCFECKKQEHLNIWKCLKQTMDEAGSKVGVLIFSRNNEKDYVTMELNDWIALLQEKDAD